jgi:Zn-dependent protease with chaperone function
MSGIGGRSVLRFWRLGLGQRLPGDRRKPVNDRKIMEEQLSYPLREGSSRVLTCRRCQGKNRVHQQRAFEQPDKLRCGHCQAQLLCSREQSLHAVAGRYLHPLDQKSMAALESVPGVSSLLRKLVEVTVERYDRLFNQSSYVRVGGSQLPSLERLFERAASNLGLKDLPELYLYQGPDINAHTGGVENHYVAISSALCDMMSDEEIVAVMAHELAHVQSQHVLYKIAARLFSFAAGELAKVTLGVGNLVLLPLQLALYKWDRCSELTADRGMLLATRDPELVLRVLMKMACSSQRLQNELSLERFMEQALRARQAPEEGVLDRVFTLLQTASRTHPFPLWRAAELWQWACQGEYLDLIQIEN